MAATLEDDDTPPDLVDVAAMPEQPVSIEEEQTPRVPITLVTGMLLHIQNSSGCANPSLRIPWSGKDHIVELHLDREAWQKDRRDHEWFVPCRDIRPGS